MTTVAIIVALWLAYTIGYGRGVRSCTPRRRVAVIKLDGWRAAQRKSIGAAPRENSLRREVEPARVCQSIPVVRS